MVGRLLRAIRSRGTVFLHDLAMIPVAWFGAYWLRFNLERIPGDFLGRAVDMLLPVIVVQGAAAWYFGLYRGLWRFASVPDLVRIVKAVVAGTTIAALVIFMLTRMQDVPRSVFPLYGMLLIGLLGGPRLLYRWFKDQRLYTQHGKRVLIVGAGRSGEMLVRDLLRQSPPLHEPTAFVDDDRRKIGKEIHGVPVVGGCDALPEVVREEGIDLVLLAVPTASSAQMRRIVGLCESAGVAFRTLPRMQDLVAGHVGVKEIRDVRIEDLLGREKVTLDWQAIGGGVTGRSILVTGGGGSIGSELCRQIARLSPSRLVVLERSEFNLYRIDHELRRQYPQLTLVAVLGDVGDAKLVGGIMAEHCPAVVFHAAAYKHVPMLEYQARPAAINNVFGTRTLADLAHRAGCDCFVLISTDKAVNPANVMGTTKRVAELYCQDLNGGSRTRFITVRFGNVLGSDGSVIPLFQSQIAAGGPVTVTHPEITRYFMTIPEACQLIMQASVMGQGGEIFVLDMGEPIKIAYLAEQLIRLSGKHPGEDIEIVYTGLRAGEKLYEELFHEAEALGRTGHPKILLAQSRRVDRDELRAGLAVLAQACDAADEGAIRLALARLVPEQTFSEQPEAAVRASGAKAEDTVKLH
jgi:FlaA1/EpsC-like NDP-sugar epimerase